MRYERPPGALTAQAVHPDAEGALGQERHSGSALFAVPPDVSDTGYWGKSVFGQ